MSAISLHDCKAQMYTTHPGPEACSSKITSSAKFISCFSIEQSLPWTGAGHVLQWLSCSMMRPSFTSSRDVQQLLPRRLVLIPLFFFLEFIQYTPDRKSVG